MRAALAMAALWPLLAAASPTGERLELPASVLSIVSTVMPESSQIGSSYLSGTFSPNLVITDPATVRLTFVHEGAGYRNTVGWFRYRDDGLATEILERGLAFPNASYADPNKGWGGGNLSPGDAVTLRGADGQPRVFAPGDRIGFFLVSDGWNGSAVTGWNPSAPSLPSTSPASNAAVARGVYTTLDQLNPETGAGRLDVARHVAMLRVAGIPGFLDGDDFVLMGFEDLRRTAGADNDFNDVVLLVDATPIEAIASSPLPRYDSSSPDPDGDGVQGLADYFPTDPTRAFVQRTPATGLSTIVFEDNYPNLGDQDYNDAVVQLAIEEVQGADGRIVDLVGTYFLVARGAGYDHRVGLAIEVAAAVTGTVQLERFGYDGAHTLEPVASLATRVVADGARTLIRLDDLFPSTRQALPPVNGGFTNTASTVPERPPAAVRFVIHLDTPLPRASLAAPPYDPYLGVTHPDGSYDIHLTGKPGFADRPAGLPTEAGATSFVDDRGQPWALLVPWDWRYPLERTAVVAAYPTFDTWRASRGTSALGWYQTPTTVGNRVVDAVRDQARSRPWTTGAAP